MESRYFEVQRWNNWEYPSHWEHYEGYNDREEAMLALAAARITGNGEDYRLIEVIDG